MDRLCCSTESGKLHFYVVHPKPSDFDETDHPPVNSPHRPGSTSKEESAMDYEQQSHSGQ